MLPYSFFFVYELYFKYFERANKVFFKITQYLLCFSFYCIVAFSGIIIPQISLYIDELTLKKLEYVASTQHKSLSKWIIDQIKPEIEVVYPEDFESLFGSINDSSFMRSESSFDYNV